MSEERKYYGIVEAVDAKPGYAGCSVLVGSSETYIHLPMSTIKEKGMDVGTRFKWQPSKDGKTEGLVEKLDDDMAPVDISNLENLGKSKPD